MVSQYRPPNVLLQEGSAYKADIDSSIASVGRIAASYLPHEKREIAEVSKVTLVDDASGSSLDGTHFFINTPTIDFYIWFNAVDVSGLPDPAFSGLTGLKVDFTTSDLASTIAATMNSIIDAQALMNSSVDGDEVTISNRDEGSVTDLSDGLSGSATGFTFIVLTQGEDGPDDLSVHIDAGYVLDDPFASGNNGIEEIAAQIIPEGSGSIVAPTTFPRIDRIVIDVETGVAELVGGAEAASPVAPDIPSGKASNCQFILQTTTTLITDALITDERAQATYGLVYTSSIIIIPTGLENSNKTFISGEMNKVYHISPSGGTKVLTLPTTDVFAGDMIEIHNLAATDKITIQSSGSGLLGTFQAGSMKLVSIQDTPTTAAHWRVLEVAGGASPSFRAYTNVGDTAVTGKEVVDFEVDSGTFGWDNNANFDTGNSRFTPTVPGRYYLKTTIAWNNIVAGDDLVLYLRRTTGDITQDFQEAVATGNESHKSSVQVPADGSSHYFEVQAQNFARDTADIDLGQQNTFFNGHRIGN